MIHMLRLLASMPRWAQLCAMMLLRSTRRPQWYTTQDLVMRRQAAEKLLAYLPSPKTQLEFLWTATVKAWLAEEIHRIDGLMLANVLVFGTVPLEVHETSIPEERQPGK